MKRRSKRNHPHGRRAKRREAEHEEERCAKGLSFCWFLDEGMERTE